MDKDAVRVNSDPAQIHCMPSFVHVHMSACCVLSLQKKQQDIYLCKLVLDDVMIQTEKGEQMVSCLSVSINLISAEHIKSDGAPEEFTAEKI